MRIGLKMSFFPTSFRSGLSRVAKIEIEDELAKIKSSEGEDIFPYEWSFLKTKTMDLVCEYMAERWTTDEVEVLTTIKSSEGKLAFGYKELDIVSGYLRP